MRSLKQSGDTIIEVLIAIVIASAVLTGAFVSAQHSLAGTRQSQERAEALKVAEEQLEHLRELSTVAGNPFTDPMAGNFTCISVPTATVIPTPQVITGGLYTPISNEDFSNAAHHPTLCTRSPFGGTSYYPTIVRSGAAGGYTFKIYVRWERVGGKANEELTLAYRFYS